MSQHRFPPLSIENAPEGSRPMLAGSGKQFGFVPSPVAKASASPALLKYMLGGFAAFDHSSLSHIEREVVAFAVAYENECHYCMALHSTMLQKDAEHAPLLGAFRAGTPLPDPKLEAIRRLARALVVGRGQVGQDEWEAFAAAGYGRHQALDVLLGVGVYVTSTYTNIFTEAEIDAPFAAQRWTKPA